jgi:hypothetical protein
VRNFALETASMHATSSASVIRAVVHRLWDVGLMVGFAAAVAVDDAAHDLSSAGRAGPGPRGPVPRGNPLPGAYELRLPGDDVTIWYTVTEHEGQEVISMQHVSLDT